MQVLARSFRHLKVVPNDQRLPADRLQSLELRVRSAAGWVGSWEASSLSATRWDEARGETSTEFFPSYCDACHQESFRLQRLRWGAGVSSITSGGAVDDRAHAFHNDP